MTAPTMGLLASAPPARGHYLTPAEGARFWAKVQQQANEPGCWLWTAARTTNGTGAFGLRGKVVSAPRVAWLEAGRVLEPGDRLLPTCGIEGCCHPDHHARQERKIGKPGSWVAGEGPVARAPRPPRRPATARVASEPSSAGPAPVPARVAVLPTSPDLAASAGCTCVACRLLDQPGAAAVRFPGGATVITPDGKAHQGDTLAELLARLAPTALPTLETSTL